MIKVVFLFFLFFIISNCSIDTKSGFWENKNNLTESKKVSDIKFNNELTFEQFKKNVINYGKLSKFPKLDN